MQETGLHSPLHDPTPHDVLYSFFCCAFLQCDALPVQPCNYLYECVSTKHEIPLQEGSTGWFFCVLKASSVGLLASCPVRAVGVIFLAGHLSGTGCSELLSPEVDRL